MTKEEWRDLALDRGNELDGLRKQCERDFALAAEWKARAAELEVELGVRTTQYETAVREREEAEKRVNDRDEMWRRRQENWRASSEAEATQLRAEVELLLAGKAGYNAWMRAAKELGADLENATESRAAAAAELPARIWEALGELTSYVVDGDHMVRVDQVRGVFEHFLAAQPAAPARTPGRFGYVHDMGDEPAAPTKGTL